MILALLLNGTIGMAEVAFGTELIDHGGLLNFDDIIQEQDALADEIREDSAGGLNLALSFGDFVRATQIVVNAILLQYFADILQAIMQAVNLNVGSGPAISDIFILMVRAVMAAIGVFTIVYMISGRGSTSNV